MIAVRDATSEADLDSARELFVEYEAAIGVDLCFQGFREEVALLPGAYSRPSGRLLLAVDGRDILGCVGLRALGETDCELKRLYVRPAARHRRVGRLLVTTVLAEARAAGYRRVLLDTLPTMTEAIALYRSLGFTDAAPYRHNPVAGVLYLALELQGDSVMPDDKPVFFHFGFNLAPGEDRLEIRIKIPVGKVLVLREFHVQLSGGKDFSLEQAWCDLSGGWGDGNGLSVTVNGAPAPPLQPPILTLNHVTATTVPADGGRHFVIGPSNVYLPAVEFLRAFCFRHPTTARALGSISVTGVLRPYEYDVSSSA